MRKHKTLPGRDSLSDEHQRGRSESRDGSFVVVIHVHILSRHRMLSLFHLPYLTKAQ